MALAWVCPAAVADAPTPGGGILHPGGYMLPQRRHEPRSVGWTYQTSPALTRRPGRVEEGERGIQQMLADEYREESRDCQDVVNQISGSHALEQAGFVLVAAGLKWCLANPEESASQGLGVDEVQKMFSN